jgi:hypothetical protein
VPIPFRRTPPTPISRSATRRPRVSPHLRFSHDSASRLATDETEGGDLELIDEESEEEWEEEKKIVRLLEPGDRIEYKYNCGTVSGMDKKGTVSLSLSLSFSFSFSMYLSVSLFS